MTTPPICPYTPDQYDVKMSFSRAQRAVCPASLWMHHFQHLPEFVGNAALKGRGAHSCFGKTAVKCIERGVPMIDEAERQVVFGEVCVEESLTDSEVLDKVAKLYQQFVDAPHLFTPEPDVTQAAEQVFWFILEKDGLRVLVEARLDHYKMRGNEMLITDYKTAERIITTPNFLADMQGPIYALAGKHRFPNLTDIYVQFDFPARDYVTDPPRQIKTEDLRRAEDYLYRPARFIYEGLQAVKAGAKPEDVFIARPGQACHPYEGSLCPVIFACPWREKAQIPAIRNDEDARTVMEAIAYREARNKADTQILKSYVAAGAVTGHGQVAAWDEEVDFKYDVPAVYEWLNQHGFPPLDYLRIDGVRIRKVREDLKKAGLVREVRVPAFDIKKEKKS